MPELPEVETVVRGLKGIIVGQKIKKIEQLHKKSLLIFSGFTQEDFEGQTIKNIERRGKGIIITLSNNLSILIHLKMTGQLIYVGKDTRLNFGHPTSDFLNSMPSKHTRVIFELSQGVLYFNDQRIFGWVKLLPTSEVANDAFLTSLGPEPLSKEFDKDMLWTAIQRRSRSPIKGIILDQKVVAGVGNIYADEALFLTNIRPERKGADITKKESDLLTENIKLVLEKGIKYRGTSLSHHRTAKGASGRMQNFLNVFRKTGQPCPICGTAIEKTRVAGRGTHYCPYCQK